MQEKGYSFLPSKIVSTKDHVILKLHMSTFIANWKKTVFKIPTIQRKGKEKEKEKEKSEMLSKSPDLQLVDPKDFANESRNPFFFF